LTYIKGVEVNDKVLTNVRRQFINKIMVHFLIIFNTYFMYKKYMYVLISIKLNKLNKDILT